MTTLKEALDLAFREQSLGNIKAFSTRRTDGRVVVWAESPDGGMYVWWDEYEESFDEPYRKTKTTEEAK